MIRTREIEIQIVFIYDTQPAQDDILKHILYFYPLWVSDEQKTALCGQIIGSIQCVRNLFAKPIVMSLNNGKFVVIQHGKFFIVVGSDKNTSSFVLQLRANSLLTLIEFFHNDLHFLQSNGEEEVQRKLQGIVKDYLKMLLISEKILLQKPMLFMPKGFDDIFIQALHILECCRDSKHVLGGIISYRNKLIASQLPFKLTQILQLTDAGILCSAKSVKLPAKLPDEVMLYEVYLSQNDYAKLVKESLRSNIFSRLSKGFPTKHPQSSSNTDINPVLYAMKKEQSLLFTSVPEEPLTTSESNRIPKSKKSRPRFLNLDSTASSKNVSRSIKLNDSTNNQIITCNTPFQEVKKIVHFNPLSICHNEDLEKNPPSEETEIPTNNSTGNFKQNYKTIGDPTFPKFKKNGKQMSYSLYLDSYRGRNLEIDQIKATKSSEELRNVCNNSTHIENNLPLTKENYFIPDKLKWFNVFNCKLKGGNLSNNSTNVLSKINFNQKKSSYSNNENTRQKCVLFRWDKCDISVSILLKIDINEDENVIPFVCEVCTKNLSKLERKMRYNLEIQNSREKKLYKFVSQSTSTLWNGTNGDWRELLVFNEEFRTINLTEIVIRSDDTMFYGYYYGPNKLFYNEVISCNGGLPFPADPMGVLQIKAKRRLEADYGLVLF